MHIDAQDFAEGSEKKECTTEGDGLSVGEGPV